MLSNTSSSLALGSGTVVRHREPSGEWRFTSPSLKLSTNSHWVATASQSLHWVCVEKEKNNNITMAGASNNFKVEGEINAHEYSSIKGNACVFWTVILEFCCSFHTHIPSRQADHRHPWPHPDLQNRSTRNWQSMFLLKNSQTHHINFGWIMSPQTYLTSPFLVTNCISDTSCLSPNPSC